MEYPFKILRALDVGLRQQIVAMGNLIWEYATQIWNDSLALFTTAVYGGINLSAADPTFPDIGVTWGALRFDAGALTTPRGITQDFANDGIRFEVPGIFQVNFSVTFKFTESQDGRDIQIRAYDATDATILLGTILSVGRNQDVLNYSTSLLVEIPAVDVGHLIQIEVAAVTAGDTLVNVTEVGANLNAVSVGEYRGT